MWPKRCRKSSTRPLVLSPVSRLVIDCNRHLDAADLIPERSDGTVIPGNLNLSASARALRIERWFEPYHAAVEAILDERAARGVASIVLSIHSMTDNLAGSHRPWQIAFSSHEDRSLVQPMIDISASIERHRGRRQSTVFDGPCHRLQHPLPCAAAKLAVSAGRVSARRSAGGRRSSPLGKAFRERVGRDTSPPTPSISL